MHCMKPAHLFLSLFVLLTSGLSAQKPGSGAVSGLIFDSSSNRPAELVTVTVNKKADGASAGTAVTDSRGAFSLENLAFGEYQLAYSYVGLENHESPVFSIDAQHPSADLGRLVLTNSPTIKMAQVQVSGRQEAFENSIDRKVYNVGKDIQSTTGSTSDLLQNIPSVQVDIDGNVSLRGDENVLILVDGKPSVLMGANRATALEQMPADSIERRYSSIETSSKTILRPSASLSSAAICS